MPKIFFFLLMVTFSIAQESETIYKQLKTDEQRKNFTVYIDKVKEIKDFIIQHTNYTIDKDTIIKISNYSNYQFYKNIEVLYDDYSKYKNNLYLSLNSNNELNIINELKIVFQEDNNLLNELYLKRNKYLRVSIDRIHSPNSVDALPKEVCERYTENNEILFPTHQNCKDKGLSPFDENKCFVNIIRSRFSTTISNLISDVYLEKTLNLAVTLSFIIDKEGKLEFINFPKSTGGIFYDLLVIKAFEQIQKSIVFCPARKNNISVSIYYDLPFKMVISGDDNY
ncbi:hypothetical protein RF683_05480 [Flavobacterium sp. 20NA77.7]|uniref:TonB C-terminal domain-containing protein n=1 Tax=Flavobacterium nakdongensis TaxID=3073563 RepID=A0ABY9R6T3_9FLAO|nr:hypothetical protein [Flavobacterium sp. 20NA77.7]WMW76952.1 hypothetical protein RF683_05480 [Flavobacterium sp. 20NA77.7]